MKKVEVKTFNMGESLLSAIVFFLLGVVLFVNPNGMIKFVLYSLGVFSILLGTFKLLVFYKTKDNENKKDVINGVVFMLLGMAIVLCTLIFYDWVKSVVSLAIAVYLIYVGINRLITAFKAPSGYKKTFFLNAIIIIAVALCLALIPDLPFWGIGLFIIGYSIIEIVGYVLCKKNGVDSTNMTVIKEAEVVEIKNTEIAGQLENKNND